MLPTTFDSDPQLRFSGGVIIALITALLVAGYGLTALLYYAVPSPIFRLESLLIPAASASLSGCPITLGITFFSALMFASLGWWTSHKITKITSKVPWPVSGSWQDSGSAHYNPYTSSAYPLTAPADNAGMYYAHPLQDYNHPAHDYSNPAHDYVHPVVEYPSAQPLPLPRPPSLSISQAQPSPRAVEEDMVGQQMAILLAKPTPSPSPEATQQTFHLEWPPGDDEGTESPNRSRSQSVTASGQLLSPNDASRQGRNRRGSDSGIPVIRVGTILSVDRRGRRSGRDQEQREERAKSRDVRRREIERNSIS